MSKHVEDESVWNPCASCDRKTFHQVLHKHVDSEYEYRMDTVHEMLRCRGCHTLSFRKVVIDHESGYFDHEDEWQSPQEVTCYPRVLEGYSELEDIADVPQPVRDIYSQSVQAIRDDANILAGIGLRATVEAICNDRSIAGRNLEKRIDGLAKAGLISHKDAERLHAIRFLGNDAAHDIKTTKTANLLIALRIIEHLLVTLYILDNEADGRLDTIIKSFDQFDALLTKKLQDFSAGDEVPLAKIFGRDMRRFQGNLPALEKSLLDKIAAGEYARLAAGKLDNYAGYSEQLQHFVVA